MDRATWSGLTLAPRVVAPADPRAAHALVAAALADGASVDGRRPGRDRGRRRWSRPDGDLLALGVAPDWRGRGLATALLAAGPPIDRGRGRRSPSGTSSSRCRSRRGWPSRGDC